MKPAFRQLFWGFIIVYFEIHIVYVDVLAEPVGYYLIYKGLKLLVEHYSANKQSIAASLFLMFYSIPTVFISNNRSDGSQALYFADHYVFSLHIGNLLLIFFIFKLMVELSSSHEQLQKRIQTYFLLYMIASFSSLIFQQFLWEKAVVFLVGISIANGIIAFFMHILFLVQLWKFPNSIEYYDYKPMNTVMLLTSIVILVPITSGLTYYLTIIATRPSAEEFNRFIENRYGAVCLDPDCTNLEIHIGEGEDYENVLMLSSGSSGRSEFRLYRNHYYISNDPDLHYRLRFYIEGKLGKFEVLEEHTNITRLNINDHANSGEE